MAEDFNLLNYGNDFSSVITQGGIPITDISAINNPNRTTEKRQGFTVNAGAFAERSSDAPSQIVYGRAKIGGNVSFLTTDQNATGGYVYIFVTLTSHEIDAVEKLYLDGQQVEFGGGTVNTDPRWGLTGTIWDDKVFMSVSLGAEDQAANADLVADSANLFPGLWTAEHRQRGCAGIYLKLKYDPTLFKTSVPKIKVLIRGKKVWDPRTSTRYWTPNGALCYADYLANTAEGCRATYDRIPDSILIAAANRSDEDIDLNGGGTEKRYTINGVFDTSRSRRSVLQSMQAAMGYGISPLVGDQYFILPAGWDPVELELNEDDVRGPLQLGLTISARDSFNLVKGTFVSPDAEYTEIDFPAVTNALYLAEDQGDENPSDVAYEFIQSAATAQRVSKISLESNRQGITVDGLWHPRAFKLTPGDVIPVTLSRYGWVRKYFRVVTCRLAKDKNGALAVALLLRETAEAVTNWAGGSETVVDLAPDTYLPDPTVVQPITGITCESGTAVLFRNGDGTIITRAKLQWDAAADPFIDAIEIEYKPSLAGDDEYQRAPSVDGLTSVAFLVNLQDGIEYDFRIRAVNGSGFRSVWSYLRAVYIFGKTEPPSDVINFAAELRDFSVFLSWNPNTDIDGDVIEVRSGGTSWDDATFLYRGTASNFTDKAQIAGTRKYFAKFFDTSGNESFLPAGLTINVPGPGTPSGSFTFSGPTAVLQWSAVSSFFKIDTYEIYYGSTSGTFGSSTFLGSVRGTKFETPADWTGFRRFYIVARDVGLNASTPGIVDILIQVPGQVASITTKKLSHFCEINWTPPATGTLEIKSYLVKRGALFGSADQIGFFPGLFAQVFVTAGGLYTFWVQPVDVAGNLGAEQFVTVQLSAPADFVLRAEQEITAFDTLENIFPDDLGFFVGPVDTDIDWQGHFTGNGWATIQDQISAGFDYYFQPGLTTGYAETVVDFGASIASGTITADFSFLVLAGTLTCIPTISWSSDNSTFYDLGAGQNVFAENFRYVRLRFDLTGTGPVAIGVLKDIFLRISVQKRYISGKITALSTDTDGTEAPLDLEFLDVDSVTYGVISSDFASVVYDFDDVPNPTEGPKFKVFDKDENRITRDITYTISGTVI